MLTTILKYLNKGVVLFPLLSFLLGAFFFQGEDQIILYFMIFPVFIGLVLKEFLLKHSSKDIAERLWASSYVSLFFTILIFFSSLGEGEPLIFQENLIVVYGTFLIGYVLANIFCNQDKYIYGLTLDFFIIQCLMLLYFFQNTAVFVIGSLFLLLWIYRFIKSPSDGKKLFFSIISSVISLVFWIYYIIYLTSYDVNIQSMFSMQSLNTFFEFLIFGIGLGIMVQNLFLLQVYLPIPNGDGSLPYFNSHRSDIKDTNKKLISRFEDINFTTRPLLIFFFLSILLICLHVFFGENISMEFFIGLSFILIPIFAHLLNKKI